MRTLKMKPGYPGQRPVNHVVGHYDFEILHRGEVVVLHENDNPGMSITNAAEYVITALIHEYPQVTPETGFIEHYPQTELRSKATYYLIRYEWDKEKKWATGVRWAHLTEDAYHNLRQNAPLGRLVLEVVER